MAQSKASPQGGPQRTPNFWKQYLRKEVLAGRPLNGLQLENTDLSNIQIAGANLSGANLSHCRFQYARLTGVNFEGADLRYCIFTGANLRNCNFRGARLDRATLTDANLNGADLEDARMYKASFEGAQLLDANLRKAKAQSTNFFDANLQNANLGLSDFREANLECTNLTGVNLYRTNLAFCQFNNLTQFYGMRNIASAQRVPPEMIALMSDANSRGTVPATRDETADYLRQRSASDLRQGDILGDQHEFEIIRKIGRGGCSTVYLARDLKDIKVPFKAVKILDSKLRTDRVQVERFRRESQIGQGVSHPNIINVYEFVHSKEFDTYYMVMNFVDGTDLGKMFRRHREKKEPFPPVSGIKIIYQVCQGLDFIHNSKIIHRDLKPGNILIKRDGGVVITDFGLSRVVVDGRKGSGLTAPGTVLGTFAYMAPEQLLNAEVDARADVYSLGVIMYEMFAGRRPFSATSILGWANTIRSKIPDRPSLYVEAFPTWLEEIIMRTLEKNPDRRYQTVAELAHALKNKSP